MTGQGRNSGPKNRAGRLAAMVLVGIIVIAIGGEAARACPCNSRGHCGPCTRAAEFFGKDSVLKPGKDVPNPQGHNESLRMGLKGMPGATDYDDTLQMKWDDVTVCLKVDTTTAGDASDLDNITAGTYVPVDDENDLKLANVKVVVTTSSVATITNGKGDEIIYDAANKTINGYYSPGYAGEGKNMFYQAQYASPGIPIHLVSEGNITRYTELDPSDRSIRMLEMRSTTVQRIVYTCYTGTPVTRVRVTEVTFDSDTSTPTRGNPRFLTTIYEYWGSGQGDKSGRLRFVVRPDGVRRYLADHGTIDSVATTNIPSNHDIGGEGNDGPLASCELDTDADADDLDGYASEIYTDYDSEGRYTNVTRGCSSCSGAGQYVYYYNTCDFNGTNDYNKCVKYVRETAPGDMRKIRFYNKFGNVVFEVVQEMTDTTVDNQWITHSVRSETDGRLLETRPPSVCIVGGGYTAPVTTGWTTSVTAGTSTTGVTRVYEWVDTNSNGLPERVSEKIKQGTGGAVYYVSTTRYGDGDAAPERVVWKTYEYPSAVETWNHASALVTTSSYTFFDNDWDKQVLTRTVTHPTVTTDNHGSGSPTSVTYHYKQNQSYALYYVDWIKHEDGSLSYTEQDIDGNVVTTIRDVDTDEEDDFTNKPAGWTSSSGVHLITEYTYDDYGRIDEVTDPDGIKSKTCYMSNYDGNLGETTHLVTLHTPFLDDSDYSRLPLQITVSDLAGRTVVSATGKSNTATDGDLENDWTASSTPGDGVDGSNLVNDSMTAFNADALFSRSVNVYNKNAQLTYNLQMTNADLTSADQYKTTYDYYHSVTGRRFQQKSPAGVFDYTVYDKLGRVTAAWRGIIGGTQSDPQGGSSNLKKITETFYDESTPGSGIHGVGDGNVTQTVSHADASTSYSTKYKYDYRNRLERTLGPDNVLAVMDLDNLGRTTMNRAYANVTDITAGLDGTKLRAKSETKYDEKGQVYQSITYEVEPNPAYNDQKNPGDITSSLTTDYWYDATRRTIKTAGPNGLFTKTAYDGVGRPTSTYVCYDSTDNEKDDGNPGTTYEGAGNVKGDTVIEQTKTYYDDGGNVWLTRHFQRKDNATGTGELTLGTEPKARITYTAHWYDAVGRLMRTVSYGTNEGGVDLDQKAEDFNPEVADTQTYDNCQPSGDPENPTTNAPNPNTTDYFHEADTGRQYLTIDNRNHKTHLTFDDLGRITKVIGNYTDNGSITETTAGDVNRTTEYHFDSVGRLEKIRARNPKGSGNGIHDQDTKYVYGATLTESDIACNDLLRAVIYPDSDDATYPLGNGPDTVYDRVEYKYDRLGRIKHLKNQRQVEHEYMFNSAGRLEKDKIIATGGADSTILRIQRSYDDVSRILRITSHGHATNDDIKNDVKFHYTAWDQVAKVYQDHGSAVDANSPCVTYTYDDGDSGGVAKYVRLNSVAYPCGSRTIYYNYAGSGVGATLSRLADIASASGGGTKYADYTYLGAVTVLKVAHPGVSGGLELTYGTGGTYGGFDRFGRIIEQKWQNDTPTVKDHYIYSDPGNSKFGYDRNSNRLYRENMLKSTLSELYHANGATAGSEHDGLDRLKEFRRGTLAADKRSISANDDRRQLYTLEALGNWKEFKNDAGNGAPWDLEQTRTHNKVNEIDDDNNHANAPSSTAIDASTGSNWIDPKYDANGNMTFAPKPGSEATDTEALHLVYDAWDRLVQVWKDDGSGNTGTLVTSGGSADTLLAKYRYDGGHRRIAKLIPGGNWHRTDYYYNAAWQVLEERLATAQANEDPPATAIKCQYVWDIRYIDAPVLRWRDDNNDSDFADPGEVLYYCTDANMNVTAVVRGTPGEGDNGKVAERYRYDPYGAVTTMHGDADADDPVNEWDTDTTPDWANEILYCGYRHDPETGLYHVRHRYHHPTLGRWTSRDPKDGNIAGGGYHDGTNLYEYVRSGPVSLLDYSGLAHRSTANGSYVTPDGAIKVKGEPGWVSPEHVEAINSARRNAQDEVERQARLRDQEKMRGRFEAWYKVEWARLYNSDGTPKTPNWTTGLTPCPCNISRTVRCKSTRYYGRGVGFIEIDTEVTRHDDYDKKKWELNVWFVFTRNMYHPGGTTELREKVTPGSPGQQCIYDKDGQLITHGVAAGSADYRGPEGGLWAHVEHDVRPGDRAFELDGGGPPKEHGKYYKMYIEVRPLIPNTKCRPNP